VNATIAEFLLRRASDAAELAQRAKVLAALTQLDPRQRNKLAEAVNTVCRTIAARGGRGKVCFSLVQRHGHRYLEVSVQDQEPPASGEQEGTVRPGRGGQVEDARAAVVQRVSELVDDFDSSGWPLSGAVIRMAQMLSPAFAPPSEAEVADWAEMIKANTALDALAFALRRARALETALVRAQLQETLRAKARDSMSDGENLNMLSAVVSTTKNAISIMDPNGTVIWVNDAFIRMTGYSLSAAIGNRLDELLFGPSTEPAAFRRFREALETGREMTQDVLQYHQDGRTFWVESNLMPVHDAAGRLARWIGIDTDITKRRQTEESLRAAKEAAEASNRTKSEFLANLSHEIRTPMNAIIGMTDLAMATDLSRQQREYLKTVQSSAESLLNLLNDILDLSKIEAGRLQLEEIDFNLADVVNDALQTLRAEAREKGLEIAANLPANLPVPLRGDSMRLRQILLNLVGNAVKFTERGGVTVEVVAQWRGDDEISLHFSVSDTGIGIPPDKLDKIFQAFTQGDPSTTRKFGGSGLGLTITAELVRMMKGHIWVLSTVGKGSTFHFTVRLAIGRATPPAEEPHASSQTLEQTPPENAGGWTGQAAKRLHVLVADDHDANRHLVITVLQRRGHACVEATNGREAVEAASNQTFDVVLMDVQMPVLDGFKATAAIRESEKATGKHVPWRAIAKSVSPPAWTPTCPNHSVRAPWFNWSKRSASQPPPKGIRRRRHHPITTGLAATTFTSLWRAWTTTSIC
jgi:PAS domain S-box-containing protein